jgi:hypothetical protein
LLLTIDLRARQYCHVATLLINSDQRGVTYVPSLHRKRSSRHRERRLLGWRDHSVYRVVAQAPRAQVVSDSTGEMR